MYETVNMLNEDVKRLDGLNSSFQFLCKQKVKVKAESCCTLSARALKT
jgi:hypothetical protein